MVLKTKRLDANTYSKSDLLLGNTQTFASKTRPLVENVKPNVLYLFIFQAAAPRPQSLQRPGAPVTLINGSVYDPNWKLPVAPPASPQLTRPSFKKRGRPKTSHVWVTNPVGLGIYNTKPS